MKRAKTFKPGQKNGYVLVSVLLVFLIVAILLTVVMTVSLAAIRSTKTQYDYQQSYYTAKAAASATSEAIIRNAGDKAFVDKLAAVTGTGEIEGMGSYSVKVEYESAERIRVTATAVYNGQSSASSAVIVKQAAGSGIVPTDKVLYVNGTAKTGLGQCQIFGDVFIDGDMTLSQGSAISGFAIVKGETYIAGAGNTTEGLFSLGSVYMEGSGKVNGDIWTKGNLTMLGNAAVMGNAYADGSLDMSNGSSKINGSALIGLDAAFGGGGTRIIGALGYGGAVTTAWGTVSSFVAGDATKIKSYTPVDSSVYDAEPLLPIPTPTAAQMPSLYTPVTLDGNTIKTSGRLTQAVIGIIKAKSWGTTIKIDTSGGDINLLLESELSLYDKGIDIVVTGGNNVFLYMTGSASIIVGSNQYVGNIQSESSPNLFIFGDGAQQITLQNNSELNACVYIPLGKLSASGSPLSTYKFVGSCIVKTASIDSNVKFYYRAPDIDNTPLDIYQPGGGGGGSAGGWTITGWS